MLKLITAIIVSTILFSATPFSFADGETYTVNVPNVQGGYTPIIITQSGDGYVGPQGEYYSTFPSVAYLQTVYGTGVPNSAGVLVSNPSTTVITIEPPALPEYDQPDPPGPDYLWTPGYWAWDSFFQDYYWVPGTWVTPPSDRLLWTPGYWHWREGVFIFSEGYWGEHIGFYGGICYGHGYEGHGFEGGEWHGHRFVNRPIRVTHINITSSFNGGAGGVHEKPTSDEVMAMKEHHVPPTSQQKTHRQLAHSDPTLRASVNHGKPAIAATSKIGVFKGPGVVVARKAGVFYNKTKPQPIRHGVGPNQHKPLIASKAQAQVKLKTKPKLKLKPRPVPPANPQNQPDTNGNGSPKSQNTAS